MPNIDLSILNQRQTPAFYADVFANRPAAGFVGRIFVSTNTFAFYRDNGTGWDLIGGPGTGTITGSGTAGTVPLWNGASTIGDSSLIEAASKFTTTKDIQADAFYLNGMTAGSGALYWTSDRVTLANYNIGGEVRIEVNGGTYAQIIAANGSTTFAGSIIKQGGTSSQFLKADGSVDSNTYNTGSGVAGQVSYFNGTNSITGSNDLFWDSVNGHLGVNTNVPGTALDVHHDQPTVAILNQTVATNDVRIGFQNNGVGLWRIGAFYNAGANDFGIYDAVAALQPVTVKKTTGQVLIGTSTVGSGKLVVASNIGDNGVQIVGASAPSLRIDNAESGPTKRAGFGISTATNNFIQGSADRDFCMFNGSTTASPILFGIYDTTNVQEAARISAARNFLIGTITDAGQKLQVNGTGLISGKAVIGGTSVGTFTVYSQLTVGTTTTTNNALTIASNVAGSGLIEFAHGVTGNQAYRGYIQYNHTTDAMSFATVGTDRLTISSSGAATFSNNVIASNGRFFVVNTFGYYFGDINNLTGWQGSNGTGLIQAFTSGSEKMRIVSGGNVLIGTTTDAGQKLQVSGAASVSGTIITGSIRTLEGVTNVPSPNTTLFTLPNVQYAVFTVYAYLQDQGTIYTAYATILQNNDVLQIANQYNGVVLSLSISGRNIQCTQGSGSAQNINWTYLRQS